MPRRTPTVRNGELEGELEWHVGGGTTSAPIVVESADWFAWLATHAAFRFESSVGMFTARKERRGGGWYWYAYQRRQGHLHTRYLGKAEDLTLARLSAAATALAAHSPAAPPRDAPPPLATSVALAAPPATAALPTGTVTFLFTDIEGSTTLWEQYPQVMPAALARHDAILRQAVAAHGGVVFKTVGDAVCAAFVRAPDALAAAAAAQQALMTEAWEVTGLPAPQPLRVRMAVHTGAAEVREGDYIGPPLNRLARLLATGHGGQILLSQATTELVEEALPARVSLRDLGTHQLKDLHRPEHIFQLVSPELPATFPPLRTAEHGPTPASAQPSPILATKLAAPSLRTPLVARDRLLRQLDAALSHKLTLLSAPAGFGKTTLVRQWLASRSSEFSVLSAELPRLEPTQNFNVAWVSLDEGDNDPVRFWRYVLSACQTFAPAVGTAARELLHTAQEPPWDILLTALINDLAQLSRDCVLVLEDYHLITAPPIHDAIAFLLDHLPAPLHLIILTRSDPPLPLARLRARNEIVELRAADLRFTLAETQTFLQQTIPFPLPHDAVTRLAERTEGWVAGLRLLTLALQGQRDEGQAMHYLTTFSGSHRPVLEFLVADVFNAQPAHLKQFLLLTSILDRLCGPLCDAVLGLGDQGSGVRNSRLVPDTQPLPPDSYSQFILDQLVRANLFLVPLDDIGQWYRYHALFAEAMHQYARQQLGEDQLHKVAHTASQWYEAHGMLADAVEAALAAQAYGRAADLIERIIAPRLIQNEYHTLRRWIAQLPEQVLQSHPSLALSYAIAILFTSNSYAPATHALLEPPLQLAEQHWRAAGNWPGLGEVLAVRALVAWYRWDRRQAFADAKAALALLPEDNVQWRGISLVYVGVEELLDGRLHAAWQTLLRARELCTTAGNIPGTLDTIILLGRVAIGQGALHQAAELFQQVLAATEQTPLARYPAHTRRGRALLGLSAIELEWNALATAERYASQALALGQAHADEALEVQSALAVVRVLHARGEQAQAVLHALIAQTQRPSVRREAEACQAGLALRAGDLAAVRRWAASRAPPDAVPRMQQEQEALIVARMQIAQGAADDALRLLAGWQAEAHEAGRTRSELEIAVRMALAYAACQDLLQARQTLRQVLVMAQPEGFQRLFLDEGEPLAALLRAILSELSEGSLAGYVRALLAALAPGRIVQPGARPADLEMLLEPLSAQEQRVLRLLAARLTNAEIAQELVVSVNTVKTHLQRIYRKLNVSSRREARDAARHLNLR